MDGYAERLTPSPGYWLLVLVAAGFGAGIAAPFDGELALVGGVVGAVAAALGLRAAAAEVTVAGGTFRAGRAHVPTALLGQVEQLGPDEAPRALGPGLDARAYVLTRPWVRSAVRVRLTDPADPTPYWVVATRRPAALAAALSEQSSSGGQAAHSEQTN